MKTTLPGGKVVNFPDSMSEAERDQIISDMMVGKEDKPKSSFVGEAITGAQHLTTAPARLALGASNLAYQGAGGLLDMLGGDQAAEWARGQARETAALSKTLNTPVSGVEIPEYQKQTIDALIPAGGAGTLAAKGIGALQGLGNPAMKLAVKAAGKQTGRAAGVASAAGEVLATPGTIAVLKQVDDSDLSPTTKKVLKATVPLVMGVGVGVTFENLLDHAFKNTLLTGKMLRGVTKEKREMVRMELGSEIAAKASKDADYVQKLNKEDGYVPMSAKEQFGDDDIPDFDTPEKVTDEPTEVLADGKLFGQIEKEADVRPTAGALGDNREKLAIVPVGDKHLTAGRFGAGRLKNGEWRMYEKAGEEYGWVGKVQDRDVAGDVLAKALELDAMGKKVDIRRLARTYRNAEKHAAKTRASATKELVKAVKKQVTVGEDTYTVDMIEASEPLLKGAFGSRKVVTGQQVRNAVWQAWDRYSLVTDGVANLGNLRKLTRVDRLLDIVKQSPTAKGNIDNINREINRALRDGDLTTVQADMIRALNRAAQQPPSFGLTIAKRGKDDERASYVASYPWIKLDPTKDGPYVYAHEFSHWGWMEVLSSADRIGAAKEIAGLVETGGIKNALPLAETAPKILSNEREIFSEMSSQFLINNVLPKYMTKGVMKAIARVAQAAKKVVRRMQMNRTVSPELERIFRKIADAPDLKRQPRSLDSVYLPSGALSKMSPEEVLEAMNKNEFIRPNPDTLEPEVADIEKMAPMDRIMYADWAQNVGDHGIAPKPFGSVDEMLMSAQQALRPIIDPSMRQVLRDKAGSDEMVNGWVSLANDIAGKIDQRVIKSGNPPVNKGMAEAAEDQMIDYYSGNRGLDQPWWMDAVMQAKVAPTVISGMVGGLEFDREDGVAIPFLGNRKLGWNPYKALAVATIVGGLGGKTGALGPAIAKASKGAAEKLWGKIEKDAPALYDLAASLHYTMRTPPDVYASLSDYLRIRPALEQQFNKQVVELKNKFTHDELSLMSDIAEQEGTEWMKAPQILHDQVKEVKLWLKDIQQGLIDAGFPEKEVNRVGENYLPRAYGPKMVMKRPITTTEATWRSLYGDFLFRRGLPKKFDMKDPAIKDVLTAINGISGLKQEDKIYQFNLVGSDEGAILVHQRQHKELAQMRNLPEYHETHAWEIERWNNKNVTLHRDYTRLERKMMGEKRDLAFRLGKFVKNAAHDTALGHAYRRIGENKAHVIDAESIADATERVNTVANLAAAGWWKVPPTTISGTEVGKYGMLTGQWVSPDAAKIVKAMSSQRYQSRIVRAAHKMVSSSTRAWKIGKTAFNPATHGYNWVANFHMAPLKGYDPFSTIASGGKSIMKKDEWLDRAVAAGMLESNVLRGELDMSKFLQEINNIERGQVIDESMGLLGAMAKFGKAKGKKAFYNALRTYEIGDEIFKLGIFKKEVRNGATDAEAMAKANDLYFDYRDIPPGIANIRDWGIMPFVSYTYKMVPTVLRSIRDYPHRALGILWFYNMLNEVMYANDFGDKAKQQQEYERATLPEHMKDNTVYPAGPWGNVRMSKKMLGGVGLGSNEGQAPFVDVSHGVPGGDMLDDSGIFGAYPFSFHPAISLFGAFVSGRDARMDKDIVNQDPVTGQDKIDNASKMLRHTVRTLTPNLPFIPGQYSYEKIGNALTAKGIIPPDVADGLGWTGKDAFGGDVSLAKEVFGMFGVLKFREPYTPEEFKFEKRRKKSSVRKAKQKFKYARKDQRSSPTELRKLKQNARDTRDTQRDAIAELNRLRDAAPDPELLKYSQ